MFFLRLFIFFVVYSYIEAVLLIEFTRHTSWIFTLALLTGSVFFGVFLVRREGLRCFQKMTNQLAHGISPAVSLTDTVFMMLAGVLFIMPGFISDTVGLLFLIPWVRDILRLNLLGFISRNFVTYVKTHNHNPDPFSAYSEDSSSRGSVEYGEHAKDWDMSGEAQREFNKERRKYSETEYNPYENEDDEEDDDEFPSRNGGFRVVDVKIVENRRD